MGILSLQFGQCGNQVGQALYSIIHEDITSKNTTSSSFCSQSINKWFNVNAKGVWQARSILIDTETKVVENIPNTAFQFNSVVARSFGGSANNWAYGYSENSKLVIHDVLNCVRREIEKSDVLMSFLNVYSLSGGTGSGVGSYVIEKLRDEYPRKTIVNCAVLPYVKGEISTQSYNSLLNLAHLYSVADSTIIFENERLLHTSKYNLGLNDVTYSHINSLISQQLGSVFQPITDIDPLDLLNHLSAHKSFKFLQIRTEPNFQKQNLKFESSQQWSALTSALSKQSRFDLQQFKSAKCDFSDKKICSALVTRSTESLPENLLKTFNASKDFVEWLPKEDYLRLFSENTQFLNYQKYLSMIFNSNSVCLPLNTMLDDAWNSFTHGAYLHHYRNYGIDDDHFLNSFQILENILDDYKHV